MVGRQVWFWVCPSHSPKFPLPLVGERGRRRRRRWDLPHAAGYYTHTSWQCRHAAMPVTMPCHAKRPVMPVSPPACQPSSTVHPPSRSAAAACLSVFSLASFFHTYQHYQHCFILPNHVPSSLFHHVNFHALILSVSIFHALSHVCQFSIIITRLHHRHAIFIIEVRIILLFLRDR